MSKTARSVLLICLLFCAGGCAHRPAQVAIPSTTADSTRVTTVETPPVVQLNPRIIIANLQVSITGIQILQGEELRQDNLARGIPPATAPQLHIWSAGIIQRPNQTVLELELTGPSPQDIFDDPENGNQIFYWDLTPYIATGDSIVICRKVKIQSYELLAIVDSSSVAAYDTTVPEYQFYTVSEPFLELTLEIRAAAQQIIGNTTNPLTKARLIFQWVNQKMTYQYPSPVRGATAALTSLAGDCGQYAYLFIALCRAAGVPARFVGGFQATDLPELGYHVWAEFWLPGYGWLPADPTHGLSQFCRLNNKRLVASVGNNIHLQHAPSWATYANSDLENGSTDFMQNTTIAYAGIRAKIKTGIETVYFGEAEE